MDGENRSVVILYSLVENDRGRPPKGETNLEASAEKQSQFANGNIFKLVLKLSIPAITAQLINALYNIVDRMYIGRME